MSDLDAIVRVEIQVQESGLSLVGFGVPLLLPITVPAGFTDPLRYYTDHLALLDDGFTVTNWAYLAARTLMSQRPRPARFAVGARDTQVAQTQLFVLPANPDDSVTYTVTINGHPCTTAALDGTSTTAELQTALIAAINGVALVADRVTASVSGADVLVTSDFPGVPFTFSIDTTTTADITAGAAVASVGIPEALAEINDFQPDWYGLLIEERSRPHIETAAAEIEAQVKIFIAQSNDAEILATPYSDVNTTTDVASVLRGAGYTRTALIYDPSDAAMLDAAWMGRCLPEIPGSITWAHKRLIGVTATRLTATQQTNLESKNANNYRPMAGSSITWPATMASGQYIDITHGLDKLKSRMQELVASLLITVKKVPFTDLGMTQIAARIRTALKESESDGFVADSRTLEDGTVLQPSWTVTAPLVADIPAEDRAARRIPASHPFVFDGIFAGAAHEVEVAGTLSF